jgi:predicted enzyme related to lactoylglutathione lyase
MGGEISGIMSDSSENQKAIPYAIGWNELATPDPKGAIKFYTELFGWKTEKFPMPGKDYTMLKLGDRAFGGVMEPVQPGSPPYWLNYVSVPDLKGTLEKAKKLGAKVCLDVTKIGEAGEIAILQDPQGAMIGLHSC